MQVIIRQSCSDNKTMSHVNIVNLLYFADFNRLAGYSLYVSNSSTTKTDGYLCYYQPLPQLLASVLQIVNCDHLGQYVIFYSERDEGGNNPVGYSDQAIILLTLID